MADGRSGFWWLPCATQSFMWLALVAFAAPVFAITPDDPGAAAIQFTLDSGQDVKPISPYIYGMNGTTLNSSVTSDRLGGNRWSGYNWETNASNAGRDWYYQSDTYLGSGQPGNAILPTLTADAAANRALIVTVPMAGYVAGDTAGPVQLADVAPSARWKEVVPLKSTKYSGPAAALSLTPSTGDTYVFTDEFVNWVKSKQAPGQQVFYDLDNEPGLWGEPLPAGWQPGVPPPCPPCNPAQATPPSPAGRTHGALHPYKPTFTELVNKTIAHASAIKSVDPSAMVFGGVGYGWNDFVSLQDAPDAAMHQAPAHLGGDELGEMHFYEYLLQQVRQAEIDQGKTLMDVLDLHWYPEARSGTVWNAGTRITLEGGSDNSAPVVAARVQAARSLWDPTYEETSWITEWSTQGAIKLLPRVQRDVNDFKPGTKIAISEYNYGGANHISGAIAEADALGVFGQQGVFAANMWSIDSDANAQFASGAFKMYLNYNGAGGEFGDTSIDADTSNIANSAIYASLDSANPNRTVVVAINRTGGALSTGIAVTHDRVFDHAEVYQLTSASASPQRIADIELDLLNAFQYTLPAWSVSTLVLVSDGLPGDFNRNGAVDAADYTVWRDSLGQTGNTAADANEDDTVDADDYALWKSNFGRTESPGSGGLTTVPEPSTLALAFLATCVFAFRRLPAHVAHCVTCIRPPARELSAWERGRPA